MTRRLACAYACACAVATIAAVAGPAGLARADGLATSVVSGNTPGPGATFTEVIATADCAGRLVSGGGTRLAEATPTVTANGIHIDGSFPTPDGQAQAADGSASPSRWLAAGGSGGGIPNDAQTLAYGVCITGGPTATTVVVANAVGPTGTFQMIHTTATCPPGSRLLSGGSRATPGTVGSLKPNGSFPSDAAGNPLLSATNPSSWTVTGLNGGGGNQNNMTYAFALCATSGDLPTVSIAHAQIPGPALATTATQQSVTCPDGTTLLGGGGFISDVFGLPGSQGDHLTGSYPSDPSGAPVGSGPASAWTAASHTGGVDSGSLTQTDVWAMCASPPGAPPPTGGGLGPAGTTPGVPAGTAPPKISGSATTGQLLRESHGAWTNQPTAYAFQWLRCRSTGTTCTAIPGARTGLYRLAAADIGSRLRVQETARNAAGPSTPSVSAATASVSSRRPAATAVIRARLAAAIVPAGRATRIAGLLKQGGSVLAFTALEAGRASISWSAKATLVATAAATFPGARATTIDVKLTPAGRRLLARAARLTLTAKGSFKPRGRAAIAVSRTFALQR